MFPPEPSTMCTRRSRWAELLEFDLSQFECRVPSHPCLPHSMNHRQFRQSNHTEPERLHTNLTSARKPLRSIGSSKIYSYSQPHSQKFSSLHQAVGDDHLCFPVEIAVGARRRWR